jgi:hypothetical protein
MNRQILLILTFCFRGPCNEFQNMITRLENLCELDARAILKNPELKTERKMAPIKISKDTKEPSKYWPSGTGFGWTQVFMNTAMTIY